MRFLIVCSCLSVLLSSAGFAQGKYKLAGYGFEFGRSKYSCYGSSYADIVNMIDDPSVTPENSTLYRELDESRDTWYRKPKSWYSWSDMRLEAFFKESGSERLVKMGLQYDYGILRRSQLSDHEEYDSLDTSVLYFGDGTTDTLLHDSISYNRLDYTVNTRNIGVSAEYLFPLNKNSRHTLYAGFGLGIGYSITQEVRRWQVDTWVDVYHGQQTGVTYYGVQPMYNPVQGTLYQVFNVVGNQGTGATASCNKTLYISPYIPLNCRTQLAANGFFSKVTLNLNASLGARIEITRGAGVGARVFYNLSSGFSYML